MRICLFLSMFSARLFATVLFWGVSLPAWSPPSHARTAGVAVELAVSALALVGSPYRYGGDDPVRGFDCSGLVRYVAGSVLGVTLPRQAEAISRGGVEVDRKRMQSGDLVFFNTLGRAFSHVGIYLGDGQFVHAPARRGQVRIERLSQPYWQARFDGARRLEALAAEATADAPAEVDTGVAPTSVDSLSAVEP